MIRKLLLLLVVAEVSFCAGQCDARNRLARRCTGPDCNLPSALQSSPAAPADDSTPLKPSGNVVNEEKPTEVPHECQPAIVNQSPPDPIPKDLNFGVDWTKIEPHKVTLNGRDITCDKAIERIGKEVPDDRKKIRLVVIGTPAETTPVAKAWDLTNQSLKDRVATWFCKADHWSLRDTTTGELRYEVGGRPTIYLLGPDGESLGRMDGFTGDQDVEAIRRAVKKYDAAKDVDLRRPEVPKKDDAKKSPSPAPPGGIHWPAFAVGAGIVLVAIVKKGSSK